MLIGEKRLREQVDTLNTKIGELNVELRRREEDLAGARQANRELMSELNRRKPKA